MTRWLILAAITGAALGCAKKSEDAAKPAEPTAAAKASASAAAAAAEAAAAAATQMVPKADDMNLPSDLGAVKVPADNPQTDEKVELGHQLFFDKRLSGDKSRACYSCHQNEDGNGGKDPIAIGAGEKKLTRHSPVIWNVGYLPRLYWDGRSKTLEEQGTAALVGGNMGVGKDNMEKKAAELGKIPGYKKQFDKVFPGKGATPETIVQALSAYERTLVCNDTAFDRYAKGDKKQLNDNQKKGLELFMGKAQCTACHAPPFFSTSYIVADGTYFNAGVGIEGKKEEEVDVGRKKVTNDDASFAAFKVPTLRNVSKSAPYFHDGSKATLEEAVRFMAGGGFKNAHLSPLLGDRHLADDEIKALVEFLGALDCQVALAEPKKLP
ncbi:MAG TPA: cytochrome c peroxidase [Polyangiaceae bacterium]|nr:cytochrome c peroxidase [Polyangiaceae bacterium]